jgi:hypothetical protein
MIKTIKYIDANELRLYKALNRTSKQVRKETKLEFYKGTTVTTLLYGNETGLRQEQDC